MRIKRLPRLKAFDLPTRAGQRGAYFPVRAYTPHPSRGSWPVDSSTGEQFCWIEEEDFLNLAIGIGIQNFPEGLAVSLPLHSAGFSMWRSFWYGQLSGMVEPVFGVLGAVAVAAARPALPYALAFAAGAMIYVVVDDIIPEANTSGNGKLATWGAVLGFVVMMCLDVGLG
ncbi:zinc transporter ZIP11-like [Ctenocephalides felis]|uniref:zinc transporter ZIP11-like n=1 Tax=Ctenocephalides felis TaxID=7515 RepID=UPI000E6E2DAF|nr:zinc transporter ZIP11-like [Ctenocephalides felis]